MAAGKVLRWILRLLVHAIFLHQATWCYLFESPGNLGSVWASNTHNNPWNQKHKIQNRLDQPHISSRHFSPLSYNGLNSFQSHLHSYSAMHNYLLPDRFVQPAKNNNTLISHLKVRNYLPSYRQDTNLNNLVSQKQVHQSDSRQLPFRGPFSNSYLPRHFHHNPGFNRMPYHARRFHPRSYHPRPYHHRPFHYNRGYRQKSVPHHPIVHSNGTFFCAGLGGTCQPFGHCYHKYTLFCNVSALTVCCKSGILGKSYGTTYYLPTLHKKKKK